MLPVAKTEIGVVDESGEVIGDVDTYDGEPNERIVADDTSDGDSNEPIIDVATFDGRAVSLLPALEPDVAKDSTVGVRAGDRGRVTGPLVETSCLLCKADDK